MNEELLYYVWSNRILSTFKLFTTHNEPLEILNPGYRNHHAGPDFLHALIKIGDIKFAGHIEFHIKSSDWNKHKHQQDASYNNVILHVVMEDDKLVENKDGNQIPTLVLGPSISPELLANYHYLLQSKTKIPCENILQIPPEIISLQWLERLAIQRLETKYQRIKSRLILCKNNWDEVYFSECLRAFLGSLNVNGAEFILREIDFGLILKYREQKYNLMALLLGYSGFLQKNEHLQGSNELYKTWLFLKRKHGLNEINEGIWKFSKTRPANFPSNRLYQFCTFYHAHNQYFDSFIQTNDLKETITILKGLLEHKTELPLELHNGRKNLNIIAAGNGVLNNLIINVIAPMVFAFGKEKDNERLKSLALNYWSISPPEKNSIVDFWRNRGIIALSALET
ncbi:MAG: DUF2851 family protein, partial [Bacteroidia bacterium]